MVSKIFRVDLVCGIDPLDPGVQDFQRGHDEIGRVEHVEHRAVRARKPRLHDEGEFGLDAGADETVGRHEPAIGKEHVVEQDAGIRLVDIERALHRLRGQADLVALDDAALGDLHLDPGLLDRVGILDGDAGMFQRQLPDLLAASSRPDRAARRRFGCRLWKGPWASGCSAKSGCGNMINMLSDMAQTELMLVAPQNSILPESTIPMADDEDGAQEIAGRIAFESGRQQRPRGACRCANSPVRCRCRCCARVKP